MTIALLIATSLGLQACGGVEPLAELSNPLRVEEASSVRSARPSLIPGDEVEAAGALVPTNFGALDSSVSAVADSPVPVIVLASASVPSAVPAPYLPTASDAPSTAPIMTEPVVTPVPVTLASAPLTATSNPLSVVESTAATPIGGGTVATAPTPAVVQGPTVPVALPAMTVTINGAAAPSSYLDTLRTRSGDWQLHSLGQHGDFHAYLMRLDSRPDFGRVMACRRAFTKEAGNTRDLSLLPATIELRSPTGSWNWPVNIAQGACRIVQNIEPVAPNSQWLREAVAQRRVPSYSRKRAWFPAYVSRLAVDPRRGGYDSASLGPVPGSVKTTPSSSANYVGVTSAQGGEYPSSRGFIHDTDARLIDAALHQEDSLIDATWSQFVQLTWYSLAQPQGAVWSERLHTTVDPQFPQPGESGWENPIGVSPKPEIRSLNDVLGWTRDVHHLENTGFVHWILTEDPVAGLLVQRQAAYALAAYYENYRKSTDTTYKVLTDQERGIYNSLSALWKSRDVSRRVVSNAGTMIWEPARAQKQATDSIAYLDEKMVAPIRNAVAGPADSYVRKIAGLPLSATFHEQMNTPIGQISMAMTSNFMLPQYGKEPLYLWTVDGSSVVKSWFEAAAGYVASRLVEVGGAAGVDGCVGIRGSSFPLKVSGTTPTFSDRAGWVAWVNQQCPNANRANFDGAYIHTSIQMEGLLLLARDAGVAGLDAAISQVQVLRSATTAPKSVDTLQLLKHMAGP